MSASAYLIVDLWEMTGVLRMRAAPIVVGRKGYQLETCTGPVPMFPLNGIRGTRASGRPGGTRADLGGSGAKRTRLPYGGHRWSGPHAR